MRREVFFMSEQEIKDIVWQVARDSATHGPGWAQEGVVLRAIRDRIASGNGGGIGMATQQAVIDAWPDLVLSRKPARG